MTLRILTLRTVWTFEILNLRVLDLYELFIEVNCVAKASISSYNCLFSCTIDFFLLKFKFKMLLPLVGFYFKPSENSKSRNGCVLYLAWFSKQKTQNLINRFLVCSLFPGFANERDNSEVCDPLKTLTFQLWLRIRCFHKMFPSFQGRFFFICQQATACWPFARGKAKEAT